MGAQLEKNVGRETPPPKKKKLPRFMQHVNAWQSLTMITQNCIIYNNNNNTDVISITLHLSNTR
jgi:hypothetical protein